MNKQVKLLVAAENEQGSEDAVGRARGKAGRSGRGQSRAGTGPGVAGRGVSLLRQCSDGVEGRPGGDLAKGHGHRETSSAWAWSRRTSPGPRKAVHPGGPEGRGGGERPIERRGLEHELYGAFQPLILTKRGGNPLKRFRQNKAHR